MPLQIVEELIREAVERGDFNDLVGAGKPIDLAAYFETPPELRIAHSVLKNAGILPREIELAREIMELEHETHRGAPPEERVPARKRIARLRLILSLLRDSKMNLLGRHGAFGPGRMKRLRR